MKLHRLFTIAVLSLTVLAAQAGVIRFPENRPAVSINIPDSWTPETLPKGVMAESPDGVATLIFEFAKSEKDLDGIIDENVDWLIKEHGVRIVASSKQEDKGSAGGIASDVLFYDATHKEYGPARVGFMFTPVKSGVLVTTFWVSKDGASKNMGAINRILSTVRPL
jgi:hypothetical protein